MSPGNVPKIEYESPAYYAHGESPPALDYASKDRTPEQTRSEVWVALFVLGIPVSFFLAIALLAMIIALKR